MLSRIGIILIIFYIAAFSLSGQVGAIDYSLPYPGKLLPDSPFYILKVFQEKITSSLISDHKQKALYYLFLSDKKLSTSQKLVDKGKMTLAATTLRISEQYFSKGIEEALKTNEEKKDSFDLWAKFTVSSSKHQEEIAKISNLVKNEQSEQVNLAYQESQESKSRVKEMLALIAAPLKK